MTCKGGDVTVEHPGFWRNALRFVVDAMQAVEETGYLASQFTSIYEFGVFKGSSMLYFHKIFPQAVLIGFDSFTGLPKEDQFEISQDLQSRLKMENLAYVTALVIGEVEH